MKEIAEEFKKQFTCLGEKIERYKTFTIPIEKEVTKIDKNGEDVTKNIPYIIPFTDSMRLMASSLPNLANSFSEAIHRIKPKYGHYDKKNANPAELNINITTVFLNTDFKDDLIVVAKIINRSLMNRYRNDFLVHTNFLTVITSLF